MQMTKLPTYPYSGILIGHMAETTFSAYAHL